MNFTLCSMQISGNYYLWIMKSLEALDRKLKPGQVYRRKDLLGLSSAVDRDLAQLVGAGKLRKVASGLYHKPEASVFGQVPADEQTMVKAFLEDDRFLVVSPNAYNSLGLGTTQLYNSRRVYNQKRHGQFKLGNHSFNFVQKPNVPKTLSKEFLLVELVNNLKNLEEDRSAVLDRIPNKLAEMDRRKLSQLVKDFGTVATKKFFSPLLRR